MMIAFVIHVVMYLSHLIIIIIIIVIVIIISFRNTLNIRWIIIGSDWRPETKQGIEGKIDRFRSGRVKVKDRVRVRYS